MAYRKCLICGTVFETESCPRCMSSELPHCDDIYFKLDEIPEELCITRTLGWQKEVCLKKADFLKLAEEWGIFLHPSDRRFMDEVEGDHIWLVGFGG